MGQQAAANKQQEKQRQQDHQAEQASHKLSMNDGILERRSNSAPLIQTLGTEWPECHSTVHVSTAVTTQFVKRVSGARGKEGSLQKLSLPLPMGWCVVRGSGAFALAVAVSSPLPDPPALPPRCPRARPRPRLLAAVPTVARRARLARMCQECSDASSMTTWPRQQVSRAANATHGSVNSKNP